MHATAIFIVKLVAHMSRILLKQLIPEGLKTENVAAGNEDDVRGNLGFFDQFIVPGSIKVVDNSNNRRTYVWFIRVPLQDPEVRAELKNLPLKSYLTNKLLVASGDDDNQRVEGNADIVRQDNVEATVRLTLRVTLV
jgi:hypothetical protein